MSAAKSATLWALVGPAAAWAFHFFASYITAAIWCAKVEWSLSIARLLIGAYTVLALSIVAWIGWRGYRRLVLQRASASDADTEAAQDRFLGQAALLLSALSAVAIVYAAIAVFVIEDCR